MDDHFLMQMKYFVSYANVIFCNILDDHFLMQMNYFVTRTSSSSSITGNILDLVFTNFESLVEDVAVFPYAFESDHFPVTFTLRRKFNRL